jgi:transmembrane sensor
MQHERIQYLLERSMSGALTGTEEAEWQALLGDATMAAPIQEAIRRMLEAAPAGVSHEAPHPVLEKVLSIDKRGPLIPLYRRTAVRWAAAAAVVLMAGGPLAYRSWHHTATTPVAQQPASPAITPGTDRAILVLSGGGQVDLNGAQKGLLSQQGGSKVIKQADGRLAYEAGNGADTSPVYNTLITPRGGKYQVTLPDGTKVWLNAASSIRFPAAFTGGDRTVGITGEAYFEVAADKRKPFIVITGQTQTRVLGTHFDVMAYPDEPSIRATLLEGAVALHESGADVLLKPGEEGAVGPTGVITTRPVNVAAAVAWKDGYYYFDRTRMDEVMRQIARWYDVDIVYQGAVPRDEIVGKIPRSASVTEVLHVMELIGLRFKIDGKKIIVLS